MEEPNQMICPDCKKDIASDAVFCPECGAQMIRNVAVETRADTALQTPASRESLPTRAWKYSVSGAVSLVEDIAKVAFVVVSTPIIFGFIGLLVGALFGFLFFKYSTHAFPAHDFHFAMLSVIYYGVGEMLLMGYLGFLFGVSKAIRYVLIERKMFTVAISNVVGVVMEYLRVRGDGTCGPSVGSIDPEKTTVTFHVLKNAMGYFKHGKVKDALSETLASVGKNKMGLLFRLIFRLIMRNEVADMLVKRGRFIFKNRKSMTAAELSGSISSLGDSAGTKMITDFYSDKVMMFSILVPIHIGTPFIIVFFASR